MYNLSEGMDLIKRWNPDPRPNNNLLTKGIPSYDDGGDGAKYDGRMECLLFKKDVRPSLLRRTLGKDEERIMRGEDVEGFFVEDKNEEVDFDLENLVLPELPEIDGTFEEEIEQSQEEPVAKKVGFWEKVKNFWKEKPLKKIGKKVKEVLFYETGDDQAKIQKNLEFYKSLEQITKTIVDKSVVVWNKVKEIYQEKPWIKFGQKVKEIIFDKKEREEFVDKCRGYFEARAKKRKELATA